MSQRHSGPTPDSSRAPPLSRTYLALLAVALLVHAFLLVKASYVLLVGESPWGYRVDETAIVASACLLCLTLLLVRWPRYSRAIALTGCVVLAVILLNPAVVALVGVGLLSAFLLGDAVLRRLRLDGASDITYRSVSVLVGLSLWIGLSAVTAPLKVHYAPVYGAGLILPLLFAWRRAFAILGQLGRILTTPHEVPTATERAWIALLVTLVVLHLFVVAKPEVGYDANAVHLQFAAMLSKHHRWPFDVTRYAWAVMPLGADYMFAAAYMLGGELAARVFNFCFGVLACQLVYGLVRSYARPELALASVCLLASTPIAFLVTGTLFSEPLWIAFLLATLVLALDYLRTRTPAMLPVFALLAAGAMECKAITLVWLVPLAAVVAGVAWRHRGYRRLDAACLAVTCLGLVLAMWPYANAWARTGNPVFPFMNALFRSPYFDASRSFYNPLYTNPLGPWSLYDLVLSSARHIEGYDGAAGWHWLLLIPVTLLAFFRRRPWAQWMTLGLAAIFFIGVYSQQSYLRYLLPAFVLIEVLAGWALNDIPETRRFRIYALVVGGALCVLNVRFIASASWTNASICPRCVWDADERARYVAYYAPDKAASNYLNLALPGARVGFFIVNGPSPSGYVGYSRSVNWHDVPMSNALSHAGSADDVLAIARLYRLTHAVFDDSKQPIDNDPIGAFRERYTTPIWQYAGRTVAAVRSP